VDFLDGRVSLVNIPAHTARSLEQDDLGQTVGAAITIQVDVQHDPELATGGSVAGGRNDQTEFFGKHGPNIAPGSAERGS
jgi:hypothetical protein